MRLIQRYILSGFLRLLAISLFAFIVLFTVVDLFENMDELLKHNVPLLAGVSFFLYRIPYIVGQTAPVAVLVSVLLSLGLLNRHGEITAIKAGGIRLMRAVAPLLVAGLVISAGVVVMNESVTPVAMKKAASFRKEWFGARSSNFGKGGMWLRTSAGIYNIMHADLARNELHGVTLYVLERPFRAVGRITAETARFGKGGWKAEKAVVWSFAEDGKALESRTVSGLVIPGLMDPVDLSDVENFQKNMGMRELGRYIKNVEAQGYDSSRYRLDLYCKLSFPLVSFVMVLVGIPFALKTGRHVGVAAGVGVSIVIAFSYWVVYALSRSMALGHMVPPLVAAAFPDILFLAAGALMMGQVKE